MTSLLTEIAPGTQFPTQFLTNFSDTGQIPHWLNEAKKQELAEKIKEVITEEEFERREDEYNAYRTAFNRNEADELVKSTFEEFVAHYQRIVEEINQKLKEHFAKEQAKALRVKNGSLNILFVPVGHGDCTVIRTPAKKTFLIDCGSSAGFDRDDEDEPEDENAILRLRQAVETLLGTSGHLDFLILTHPDKDHYNKLRSVFTEELTIGKIYHSAPFSEYGEQTWFTGKMFGNNERLAELNARNLIRQVTFRYADKILNDKNQIVDAKPPFITRIVDLARRSHPPENYDPSKPNLVDCLDEDGGLLIWAEPNCRVSILSSDVDQEHIGDSSTTENRGSVVVLIKSFGQKILLCGDGTFNTEIELVARYGQKIENIDVLRVGHHGSSLTSSDQQFTNHVKAKTAWISESADSSFHSPSFEVIQRLWKHADTDSGVHDLCFWDVSRLRSYSHFWLSKCNGETFVIDGEYVTFTPELIAHYSQKQVHLTAATLNTMIEIKKK